MPMKPGWLVRVTALLRSGGGPRQLAAGVALGLVGSVCPILGVPTPLLTVLALWKRLNLPLVQAVNYAAAPLQWLLIVPFLRVGEWVWRAEPLPLSPREIVARIRADAAAFFQDFSMAAVHAATGWLLLAIPAFLLVRAVTLRLLERRQRAAAADAGMVQGGPRPPGAGP